MRCGGGTLSPGTAMEIFRTPDAGHYIQEDQGERLAEVVAAFVRASPTGSRMPANGG